jgi:putative cell wall-binding protein
LTPAVEEELKRLSPRYVYILGSTQAISSNIEKQLADIVGGSNRVERLKGDLRYDTAKSVADVVASRHSVNEIFVTTGDENSSDSLAIAPVAGEGDKPILLTNSRNLSQAVRDYIREQGISKVTIIGGNVAVSQNVENQLNGIVNTVERIEGDDRFDTNIAIIEEYYTRSQLEDVFIAQGMDTADALTASPFAAKQGSPLLLTMSDRVPSAVNSFLSNRVSTSPDLYFLGGDQAISNGVRNSLLNLVK